MPGLKHATKKRLARSVTRRRTLHSAISAEHLDFRKKLTTVSSSITRLIREIRSARQVWLELARHQSGFAEALAASLPSDGAVRSHAREVETTVQQLRRLIIEDDAPTAPHRRIVGVLEGYLTLVRGVEKTYPELEVAFSEVLRYQRKVDKLGRKKKKEDALRRNVGKLNDARAVYDKLLADVIAKQKEAFDKHEAVFQCAHHAFWIAHDQYAHVVNEATKTIRQESVAVREHLVNIDISNSVKLTAIPRVRLLPPPMPDVVPMPTVEHPEVITPPSSSHPSSQIVQQSVSTDPRASPPTQVVQTVGTVPVAQTVTQMVPPSELAVPHFQEPVFAPTAPPENVFVRTQPDGYMSIPVTPVPKYTTHPNEHPVVHLTPQKPAVSVRLPEALAPRVPSDIPAPPPPPPQANQRVHVVHGIPG